MGPIGSAVLTFIGYKRTDKQTDKPNLYIDCAIFELTLIGRKLTGKEKGRKRADEERKLKVFTLDIQIKRSGLKVFNSEVFSSGVS